MMSHGMDSGNILALIGYGCINIFALCQHGDRSDHSCLPLPEDSMVFLAGFIRRNRSQ